MSTLFGTLFSSAVRDYSFNLTYPLHYPEIAIAQNADLLPFSYQLEFDPDPAVFYLLVFSFSIKTDARNLASLRLTYRVMG